MSMRNYAISEYGMVLSESQIYQIAKVLIPAQEWAEEDWESADIYDFIDKLDIVSYCSDFEGEALMITDDGYDWDKSIIYNNSDFICYIPLDKYPTLFKAAYCNIEEAKNEIRERICDAIDVNIYNIVGTYFG